MKKVMVVMAAMLMAVAGTAHAAPSVDCDQGRTCAKHACERLDNAGFCMIDPPGSRLGPAMTRVSLNDQGRMQLDRLIARLR